MPKEIEPNYPYDVSARLVLLHELESGRLDSIECPICHAHSISVWFTHPAENEYRTWFVCHGCSFKLRAQNTERSQFYSSARINDELQAYDVELFAQGVFPKLLDQE
jgi:hypothetical protein